MTTIRGAPVGVPGTPGETFDPRNEAEFRRTVMQALQSLADQIEEIQKRIDKALVEAVLDHAGDGHYKLGFDKRTEDATLSQDASGHYGVTPDDLSGVRFIKSGEHYKVEA